jgi:hypothetical protein
VDTGNRNASEVYSAASAVNVFLGRATIIEFSRRRVPPGVVE